MGQKKAYGTPVPGQCGRICEQTKTQLNNVIEFVQSNLYTVHFELSSYNNQ